LGLKKLILVFRKKSLGFSLRSLRSLRLTLFEEPRTGRAPAEVYRFAVPALQRQRPRRDFFPARRDSLEMTGFFA